MVRRIYPLMQGGEVALDFEKDVQAVIPQWDGTKGQHYARVITTNGTVYNVKGEGHRLRA